MIDKLIFKKTHQIYSFFTKPFQKLWRGKESIAISKIRINLYCLEEKGSKNGPPQLLEKSKE